MIVRKVKWYDIFKLMSMHEKSDKNYKVMFASDFPILLRLYHMYLLVTGKVVVFIAYGHMPIGFSYVDLRDPEVATLGIYMKKRNRGQGLARFLFGMAIDYARNETDRSIELSVFDWNTRAYEWYRRQGFKEYKRSIYMVKE